MANKQNSVDTGSKTSSEQAAETSQETAAAETTEASQEQSQETSTDAVGAANAAAPAANESRTGFVSNARAGDECTCPDGRKGTVHKFDTGLVCIPNHEQGN